ncbi:MAG: ABC transporter substrate-binding protein [Alphaproteobacteria bacterium]|jgi:branched-chain amino acid transport system substrate-binding protein|nr:hypothetical protein [Rhodospirillaceae bacterium]MDP6407055.1 ABC transporter substrate-binding protein [Alphaproteobacteria bacterium]MDP6624152.1 ABC transporter substrate-binding protein [Alphaproteobacteria bacterium]
MKLRTGIGLLVFGIALGAGIVALVLGLGQSDEREQAEQASPPVVVAAPRPQPAPPRREPDRALMVGVVGPETGDNAAYGLGVLEGVRLAVKHFNAAGGVDGQAIEIVHYDNRESPDRTMGAVEELINRRALAIFAAPTGWSTFAPTHQAAYSGTIFMAVGTRRRIGGGGGTVFHFALSETIAVEGLMAQAARLGYNRYALVTSAVYDYSLTLSSAFKQVVGRHGGRILVEADSYDSFSGRTDLQKVAAALAASPEPLQAVIYTGGASEAAELAQALSRQGTALPLIGGEDLLTEEFLGAGGEAVLGSLLYATFAPDDPAPMVTEFVAAYRQQAGQAPDRFAALAYDAFGLLAQAIVRAQSRQSSKIRDALVAMPESPGVTGPTRWTPDGAPLKQPFLYRVEAGAGGRQFTLLRSGGR